MCKRKTTPQFIQDAQKVHGIKYNYSKVNYINAYTKVCIICPKHGKFWQNPHNHLHNKGCSYCVQCGAGYKINTTDFIIKAKNIHGNKYDYSNTKYQNSHTKVCIICPKHGKFYQSATNHLSGNGCPKCRQSHGEKQIEQYLKEHNIKYETQKRFNKCMQQKELPFDFYLPELNTCIEYDGKQHFQPVQFGGISQQLAMQRTQENDKIKNQFCKNNQINLIRISFQHKITNILNSICHKKA